MAEHPNGTATNGEAPAAYVTLILDETGSMQHCKGAAIAGVNEYLNRLRRMPTPVRFTLTLFNSGKLEVRHRNEPVVWVPNLTEQTYQPADTTPLYDAIGSTLTAAVREAPAESKKLCAILTDGLENASREYSRDDIARLIRTYQDHGWTFVYLGADHDAWAAGKALGLADDNSVQFSKRDIGRTFDRLSKATMTFLSAGPDEPPQGFWKDKNAGSGDNTDPNGTAGS